MSRKTETAKPLIESLTDESSPIIDKVLEYGNMTRDDDQKQYAKQMLSVFADEFVNQKMHLKKDVSRMISERVAQIDQLLTEQINEILHNPEFQKLEASWRGVHQLVESTQGDDQMQVRVLDVTKEDILADAEASAEFDQSGLFKLVYENEYGTFGGQPYGMLVGDYYFGRGVEDIACLKAISQVAAAAHAPFISAASPEAFNIDNFQDLHKPKSLEKLFNSAEFGAWNKFRSLDESKYVCLTLPRTVMRLPYGPDGIPVKEFSFQEKMNAGEDDKYLWGNAAFSLAQRITESFLNYGWFSNIRGVENGGAVNLPIHSYVDAQGNSTHKVPVETVITDRREKELDDLGFLPLVYKRGTDTAVFFGSKTIHKVKEFESDEANANAQLTVQLPYLMAVSRFAHYLKVIMRDKVGSFSSRETVSSYLNNWISRYVYANDEASTYLKSVHPLREAAVEVVNVPGKVGAYRAVISMKPHFYLNELTVSMRMVTDLAKK